MRIPFADFVDRYKLVLYTTNLPTSESSCRKILKQSQLKDWQIGRTKVFLKYWHTEKLGEQLQKAQEAVITIQKAVRGFLARTTYKRLREEAMINAKQTATFLKHSRVCGNSLFLKQDELQLHDHKKKEEILKKRTLNYIAVEFPSSLFDDEDDFPPPPSDALGLPPKMKSPVSLEEIEFVDEFTDDLEDEEDEFVAQPHPIKSGFGGVPSKEAAVQWFQETQAPNGVVQEASGVFSEWFHGIIPRRESERLLSSKPVGCFLIRVSESRFGYTLSYRVQNRCKHFMIDQTRSGKFVIVGMPRVYKSLKEMVDVHKKEPITADGDLLVLPCGQESEEEADYVDLIAVLEEKEINRNRDVRGDDGAPPLPPKSPKRLDGSLPPPLPARNYQGTKLR